MTAAVDTALAVPVLRERSRASPVLAVRHWIAGLERRRIDRRMRLRRRVRLWWMSGASPRAACAAA